MGVNGEGGWCILWNRGFRDVLWGMGGLWLSLRENPENIRSIGNPAHFWSDE